MKRRVEKIEERLGMEPPLDEWSEIEAELAHLFVTFLMKCTDEEAELYHTFAGVYCEYFTEEESGSTLDALQAKLDDCFISWLIKEGREDMAEHAAPSGFYGVDMKINYDLSGFSYDELKRLVRLMTHEGDEEGGEA